ncbi:MAG: DUF4031 domain-containing protein [Propionibacteriales bacterium]|nr:DUF4031 domain-containing protein [Propionibacteriales bacterium]
MTVYVDDAAIPAGVGAGRHCWSRLFADSPAELEDFRVRLGAAHDCGFRHEVFVECRQPWRYVTEAERTRAILMGAIPVRFRDTARLVRERCRTEVAG